ncbi:MAG TPA: hypothetical protein ENI23_09990 [bacterium]|nr:hypothetical protein [bacterium]
MPSDPREVKLLKYAIIGLVFIMGSLVTWNSISISTMPNSYVRLERYKEDKKDTKDSLTRIENKLDHLISKD